MDCSQSPANYISRVAKQLPNIWSDIDSARKHRSWPQWCFIPLADVAPLVGTGDPVALSNTTSIVTGLAAWRTTQGIYRFDPALHQNLIDTPITNLPAEVLTLLPEWGVYVETTAYPGARGFFAWCEFDYRSEGAELRFLIDTPSGLFPIAIPLVVGTLSDAIASVTYGLIPDLNEKISGPVSLLLYICSVSADLGKYTPTHPEPKKVKKGERIFPPHQPSIVTVGESIGGALRASQAYTAEMDESIPTGRTVASHIRRAHWHGFWVGKPRRFEIR